MELTQIKICAIVCYCLVVLGTVHCQECSQPMRLVTLGRPPLLVPDMTSYPDGTMVTFTCSNTDDVPAGPPSVTCSNGVWDPPTIPNCLKRCDDPGDPINGHKVGTPTFDPYTSVTFACDGDTDTLVGADTLTCDDGVWDNDVPTCPGGCGDPGSPDNGMQNRTSTSFSNNGVIGFSCNAGYQLIGTDTLYCNNGTWSDSVPQCDGEMKTSYYFISRG
ncbi:complement decay-accelerating factor transmembrane isoform-like [Ptychodera flava]|uniref:complement decay-accelerating factor transmembrane isoform-like n=1 Tax=Ptychodera flava TaxID=63121 RepID=UPI00396A0AA6